MCSRTAVLTTWAVVCLLAPAQLWAQATVSGRVTAQGDAVEGASVFLIDTEVFTDEEGNYSFDAVPAGEQTLIVFVEGYRSETRTVTVGATGEMRQNFELVPDLLYSDSLVVTATRNPQTKRESSVSITTLDETQIEERAARNTADLLRVVPGFYVESSGGEVGGNLWARGLPADGSYRYVALMEDGMPVFDSTELFFVNSDIFVRVDKTVAEMEAVRGGNAALFGSNAPGGVVNLISRTGTNVPQTDVELTVGTDGLGKVDFDHGGPLAEGWTYNVGGFYRYDEGVRDPGFTASEGGQIRANLSRTLERGYLRFYGKYLNDSNIFYLPLPFQAGGDYVAGFPFDGTLTSDEANGLSVPLPGGGRLDLPLDDGQKQDGFSLAGELSIELGGGWLLEDRLRYIDIDHTWNALVPGSLVNPEVFAADFVPRGGRFEYSFTNLDQPFATANELLLLGGIWRVDKPMENLSNQLQVSKQVELGGTDHSVSIGTYFGTYDVGNAWSFNDILTDVRSQPRLVDLTVFNAAGIPTRVTEDGFRRYGSNFVNADGDVDILAFFVGDQIQLNPKWRLDLGARYEENDFHQVVEETDTFNLGDPSTLADNEVFGGTGRFVEREQSFEETAVSVGVNYLLNDRVALWGRASSGYKMPILDNFLFADPPLEAEGLLQYEVGARFGTPRLGLNATAYFLTVEDFPSQDARIVDGETVFVTDFVGEAETLGLEAELVAQPLPGLDVSLSATLQQPEYTDFFDADGEGEVRDFSGNTVRRVAEEIFDVTVSYGRGRWRVGGNWNYYGDRFANNANSIVLPSYDVTTFRGSYELTPQMTLALAVNNAFNSKGLTEGNPRTDEDAIALAPVFLARPVLPRRTTLSLAYRF